MQISAVWYLANATGFSFVHGEDLSPLRRRGCSLSACRNKRAFCGAAKNPVPLNLKTFQEIHWCKLRFYHDRVYSWSVTTKNQGGKKSLWVKTWSCISGHGKIHLEKTHNFKCRMKTQVVCQQNLFGIRVFIWDPTFWVQSSVTRSGKGLHLILSNVPLMSSHTWGLGLARKLESVDFSCKIFKRLIPCVLKWLTTAFTCLLLNFLCC